MCGNTQIPASSMKKAMTRLTNKNNQTDKNGYETQFHVSESCNTQKIYTVLLLYRF